MESFIRTVLVKIVVATASCSCDVVSRVDPVDVSVNEAISVECRRRHRGVGWLVFVSVYDLRPPPLHN